LWPAEEVRRWTELLAATADPVDTLRTLVTARASAAQASAPVPRWIPAVPAGLRRGLTVAAVAEQAGVGERTLHRMSVRHFGYGAKTLARILRMRTALDHLRRDIDISAVAHAAGYADYSHMFREFRELAGASPVEFVGAHSGQ
ncbi:MAG: helix-turn-helix transcriptional regulator, partial [Gordonia sp. (in: high G+C Gram-positive bacteria)]